MGISLSNPNGSYGKYTGLPDLLGRNITVELLSDGHLAFFWVYKY